MTRDDFKIHVQETIDLVIEKAEQHVGQKLPRHYCFDWILPNYDHVPQEQVVEFITQNVYVDPEHIYPCFDIGVADMMVGYCFLVIAPAILHVLGERIGQSVMAHLF